VDGRRARALAAGLLATALMGCVSSRLAESPPPGYSLAGSWKLDPAHSTDAHQALQQLRAHAMRHPDSENTSVMQQGQSRQHGGHNGGADILSELQPSEPYPVDLSLQSELLRGGDWLQIQQSASAFVISNGDTTHAYTPGEKSVVSVPGGVADQISGWKGKQYVIEIRPQVGPHARATYSLSDKGGQLIQTIRVDQEGRVPKLEVTRVYDPAGVTPKAVPAGD